MSKKCIKCGAELEDAAVFCDECGEQQNEAQPVVTQQPQVQNTARQVHNAYQQNSMNVAEATGMKNSGMGIASLVLGIISICTLGCLFIPEILGIIFGIIALQNKNTKHDLSIAGLVMSAIAFIFVVIVMFI